MSSVAATDEARPAGWRLTICAAALVCLLSACLLAAHGAGEEGWRSIIRATARTSVALFLAAFAAPAIDALRPSRWTRRLRANRAHLFAAFAASHLVHAAAIVALARQTNGASLADRSPSVVAFGGLVYLFILYAGAMACAPFAAWAGRRAWAQTLHAAGLYAIWLTFFNSYGGRAVKGDFFYAPFAVLLVAALALDVLAARPPRGKSRPRERARADAPAA
jgi:hypothetical protein